MQPIDIYAVAQQITWAFRPLMCSAEVYDFEKQIRYRVFGPAGDTPIVSVAGLPAASLLNPRLLQREIARTRACLERQGVVLGELMVE